MGESGQVVMTLFVQVTCGALLLATTWAVFKGLSR